MTSLRRQKTYGSSIIIFIYFLWVKSKQSLIGLQLGVESGVMAVIDDGGVVGINYGVTAAGQPLTTSHPLHHTHHNRPTVRYVVSDRWFQRQISVFHYPAQSQCFVALNRRPIIGSLGD